MIRNDFVSNSSSSSFIVAAEDNKYDILLQDYDVLDLKAYIDHFIFRDMSQYGGLVLNDKEDLKKFVFVSNTTFNKLFDRNISFKLPDISKPFVDKYLNKKSKNYDDIEDFMKALKKVYYDVLKLKWENCKFHYSEIDNNMLDEDKYTDYLECNTMTDLVESRINYMNDMKTLKFLRIFNN